MREYDDCNCGRGFHCISALRHLGLSGSRTSTGYPRVFCPYRNLFDETLTVGAAVGEDGRPRPPARSRGNGALCRGESLPD
jgi:hypothetical protein